MRKVRSLTIILVALVCILVLQTHAYASAPVASGTCGSLTWSISEAGVLTITGKGVLRSSAPWHDYNDQIISVVVDNRVTRIDEGALDGLYHIKSLSVPFLGEDSEKAYALSFLLGETPLYCETTYVTTYTRYYLFDFADDDPFWLEYCEPYAVYDEELRVEYADVPTGGYYEDNYYHYPYELERLSVDRGSIADWALEYCTNLKSIVFGSGITTLERYAFSDCSVLTDLYATDASAWCNINFKTNHTGYADRLHFVNANGQELTQVILDSTVVSIPDYAFAGCTSLTSVTIGDSATSIGAYAFKGCTGLSEITMGSSATTVGESAFYGCTALDAVYIKNASAWCNIAYDNGLANPQYYAKNLHFLDDRGQIATQIVLDSTVTSIPDSAFAGNTVIESITIPDSVTAIGNSAFKNCIGLQSLTIPGSVTAIGDWAFTNCTGLQSLTILRGATTIGSEAFRDCTSLVNITIPESVTTIGSEVFRDCTSLVNITIPKSVTTIGTGLFHGCSNLVSITTPFISSKSQNHLGYFFGSTAFEGSVRTEQPYKNSYGLTAYRSYYIPETLKHVKITNRSIPYGAFYNCSGLTEIEIVSSYNIGEAAFYGCSSLTSLTLPYAGSYLGKKSGDYLYPVGYYFGESTVGTSQQFYRYSSQYRNYIPSGTKCYNIPSSLKYITVTGNIRRGAFQNFKNLQTVTFEKGVQSVGEHAFKGCTGLKSLYLRETATWWNMDFGGEYANPRRYTRSVEILDADGNVTKELVLDNTVTKIPSYCFEGASLETITIPDSVTYIGSFAFYNCANLRSIDIPDSVITIDSSAFRKCSKLSSVTFGSGVETIGNYAFSGCSWLTAVTIPGNVKTIGSHTFNKCTAVTDVIIEDGVTVIDEYAFSGCSTLTKVSIPTSITSVENGAFALCDALSSVVYAGTGTQWRQMYIGPNNKQFRIAAPYCYDHDFVNFISNGDMTCTVDGTKTAKCEYCEVTNTVVDPARHIFESYIYNEDTTCTVDGTETAKCERCDVTDTRSIVDSAPGHSFEDYVSNNNATCTKNATETRKCENCDNTETRTIPNSALGHSFTDYLSDGNASYESDGTKTAKCDRCDVTDTQIDLGSQLQYVATGTCGDMIVWKLQQDGVLIVVGRGRMYDYNYDFDTGATGIPWYDYCERITQIQISKGVTTIGKWVFRGCNNLTAVTIPDGVTEIGSSAFWLCTGLETVQLPESLQSLGNSVFYKCSSLKSVTVPEGITTLGSNVFNQCTQLESVTLPMGITGVGDNAFRGCSALADIYYGGTLEQWKTITVGSNNKPLTQATLHYHVHSFTSYVSDSNATCLEGGTKTAKCDYCDATDTRPNEGSKLGHSFTNYISNNNATYTADGTKTAKCDRCDVTDTVTDPGTMLKNNGWKLKNGKWYFYDNGNMVKNQWRKDSTGWVYLGEDGAMLTNSWCTDSQGWCYVGADGYAVTNCWKKDSIGWIWLNSSGSMTKNAWIQDGSNWYYLDGEGYMVTNQWRKDSTGWVYLGEDGAMLTNSWCTDSQGWCYVGADGYAVTNCWKKDSIGWIWLNSSGSMTKNAWIQDGGNWYYLDAQGYMLTSTSRYLGGKTYYFNASGICTNP